MCGMWLVVCNDVGLLLRFVDRETPIIVIMRGQYHARTPHIPGVAKPITRSAVVTMEDPSWDVPSPQGTSPVTQESPSSTSSPRKNHSTSATTVDAAVSATPINERLRRDATHSVASAEDYMCALLDRRDHMFATHALGSSLLELELGVAKACLELTRANAECAMRLLKCGDWRDASTLLSRARSLLAHVGTSECVAQEKRAERFVANMLADDRPEVEDDNEFSMTLREQTSSSNLRRVQSKRYVIPSAAGVPSRQGHISMDITHMFEAATLHRRFEYFYSSASDDPYGLGRMLQLHPAKLRAAYESTIAFVNQCNRAYEATAANGTFLHGRTRVERELLPPGWPLQQQQVATLCHPRPPAGTSTRRQRGSHEKETITPMRPSHVAGTTPLSAIESVDERHQDVPRMYLPRHRVKVPTKLTVTAMGPEECMFGHGARDTIIVASQNRPRRLRDAEADSELDECGAMKALDTFLSPSQHRSPNPTPSSQKKKRSHKQRASHQSPTSQRSKRADSDRSLQLESPRTAASASPPHSLSSPPSLGVSFNHASPTVISTDDDDASAPLPRHGAQQQQGEASTSTWASPSPTASVSRMSSSLMSPSPTAAPPTKGSHHDAKGKKAKSSKRGKKSASLVSQHSEESGDFPTFLGTLPTLDAPGARARRGKMPPRRRGVQKRKSILLSPNLTEREKRRILLQTTIRIQRWYRRVMWWVTSRDRLVSLRFDRIRARRLLIRCYAGFAVRHHLTTSFARDRAILRLQYAFRCFQARRERGRLAALRDRDIRQRERSEGLLGRVVHMMGDNYEAKNTYAQRVRDRDVALEERVAREANDVEDMLAAEEFTLYAAQVRIKRRTSAILSHIASVDPNLYRAPGLRAQEEERELRARVAAIQLEDAMALSMEREWAQTIISKYYRRHQQRAEIQRRKTEDTFQLHFFSLGAAGSDMVTEVQLRDGRHAQTLYTVMKCGSPTE